MRWLYWNWKQSDQQVAWITKTRSGNGLNVGFRRLSLYNFWQNYGLQSVNTLTLPMQRSIASSYLLWAWTSQPDNRFSQGYQRTILSTTFMTTTLNLNEEIFQNMISNSCNSDFEYRLSECPVDWVLGAQIFFFHPYSIYEHILFANIAIVRSHSYYCYYCNMKWMNEEKKWKIKENKNEWRAGVHFFFLSVWFGLCNMILW